MPRYYKPITEEQLTEKLVAAFPDSSFPDIFDPGDIPSAVAKDIAKVKFDFENYDSSDGFCGYPCGLRTLPNGMPALFVNAGGDWEYPVCFLIYWDGSGLRGYVPKSGNVWRRKAKEAFGDPDDSIIQEFRNLVKEAGAWSAPINSTIELADDVDEDNFWEYLNDVVSADAIYADVMARIQKR